MPQDSTSPYVRSAARSTFAVLPLQSSMVHQFWKMAWVGHFHRSVQISRIRVTEIVKLGVVRVFDRGGGFRKRTGGSLFGLSRSMSHAQQCRLSSVG